MEHDILSEIAVDLDTIAELLDDLRTDTDMSRQTANKMRVMLIALNDSIGRFKLAVHIE